MNHTGVAAVGVLTGWGEGTTALPENAAVAARGRRVVPIPPPRRAGERWRRVPRECLLGVAGVEAMLRAAALPPSAIEGSDTALLFVTAAAYGASNCAFIEGEDTGALHFPYTAPSAVPAEVAIEFGLTGPYAILIGGPRATIDALWYATRLLSQELCRRALVLAVETFEECERVYARGRWLTDGPLVEATACALIVRGDGRVAVRDGGVPSPFERMVRERAGETFACAPLIALGLALEAPADRACLSGEWRRRRVAVEWAGGSV